MKELTLNESESVNGGIWGYLAVQAFNLAAATLTIWEDV